MKRKHTHRWRRWGYRGMKKNQTFISEGCKCGERRERPATEPERLKIHADHKLFMQRNKLLHVAWRPVQDLLKKYATSTTQDVKWRFMNAMERLQKKYPDYIRYVRVDDACHANSDLWFVSHKYDDPKLGRAYWGTSVVYIGQCSDDPPVSFFCYPEWHMRNLRATTALLDKEARLLNKGKRIWER